MEQDIEDYQCITEKHFHCAEKAECAQLGEYIRGSLTQRESCQRKMRIIKRNIKNVKYFLFYKLISNTAKHRLVRQLKENEARKSAGDNCCTTITQW